MSPIEPESNAYRREFSPRDYLVEYYEVPDEDKDDPAILSRDSQALFRFLAECLSKQGRVYGRAIDVGCGPTVHHTFALAPYAAEITLADYVPANLAEAKVWVDAGPEAFDWNPHFRHILALEGNDPAAFEERKRLLRSRIAGFKVCDLRDADPVGDGSKYDLVTSFFCTEAVTSDKAQWRRMTRNLASLLKPGGTLIVGALCRCRHYDVGPRSFTTTYLEAGDFAELFAELGFAKESVRIEEAACPEWKEYGFDSVLMAMGSLKPIE